MGGVIPDLENNKNKKKRPQIKRLGVVNNKKSECGIMPCLVVRVQLRACSTAAESPAFMSEHYVSSFIWSWKPLVKRQENSCQIMLVRMNHHWAHLSERRMWESSSLPCLGMWRLESGSREILPDWSNNNMLWVIVFWGKSMLAFLSRVYQQSEIAHNPTLHPSQMLQICWTGVKK